MLMPLPKWKDPNWWMVLITALLAVFAGYTLSELRNGTHLDQRAWVNPTITIPEKLSASDPFISTIHVSNSGKTAARRVFIESTTITVKNGSVLNISYDPPVVNSVSGLLYPGPNYGYDVIVNMNSADPPVPLSTTEYSDLSTGHAYAATFFNLTYVDVFGVSHWVHACSWHGYVPYGDFTARTCAAYNDVDDN
jgi:hypothetical protein